MCVPHALLVFAVLDEASCFVGPVGTGVSGPKMEHVVEHNESY